MAKVSITDVEKFNPYHDARGRFTTGSGATSFTLRTRDPAKQHLVDRAIEREKQRAASTPKRNAGFDQAFSKERGDKIQSMVDSCPNKDVKRVWDKHFSEANIVKTESTSQYRTVSGDVLLGRKHMDGDSVHEPNETAFHEIAHMIDHKETPDTSRSVFEQRTFSETFGDGEFVKTLRGEYNELEKNFRKQMEAELGGKVHIDSVRAAMKTYFSTQKEPFMDSYHRVPCDKREYGCLWDIMQGCSKSKVKFPVGHADKYFQGSRADQHLATEAFANMFGAEVSNPKAKKRIQMYFPKSYDVFERMLGEL